jgi:deoxycytidine triphosphate deaminase
MSFMSDVDLRRALDRDIVIEPLHQESITPVGYDLRLGDFVYSLAHGLLYPSEGRYRLPAHSTIQILTKESVWVSHRISGTIHSRVLLVSRGLSHISTTLDPLWGGPLLITFHNNAATEVELPEDAAIATLVFHRLRSPTRQQHREFAFVKRIILEQFGAHTEHYIQRVSGIIARPEIGDAFAARVHEANRLMPLKIARSVINLRWRRILLGAWMSLLWALLFAIGSLHTYWTSISPYLGGLTYDTKVFAGQLAAFIALLALLKPSLQR